MELICSLQIGGVRRGWESRSACLCVDVASWAIANSLLEMSFVVCVIQASMLTDVNVPSSKNLRGRTARCRVPCRCRSSRLVSQ